MDEIPAPPAPITPTSAHTSEKGEPGLLKKLFTFLFEKKEQPTLAPRQPLDRDNRNSRMRPPSRRKSPNGRHHQHGRGRGGRNRSQGGYRNYENRDNRTRDNREQQPRDQQVREHQPRDHQPRDHQQREHQPREHQQREHHQHHRDTRDSRPQNQARDNRNDQQDSHQPASSVQNTPVNVNTTPMVVEQHRPSAETSQQTRPAAVNDFVPSESSNKPVVVVDNTTAPVAPQGQTTEGGNRQHRRPRHRFNPHRRHRQNAQRQNPQNQGEHNRHSIEGEDIYSGKNNNDVDES